MSVNKEQIIEVLKTTYDPEIPVDLWNLGLIYDISIEGTNIDITMSLTTPGCGMAQFMADDIKHKVSGLDGVDKTAVHITFDPPWKPEMMSDEAKVKLGFAPSKNQMEEPSQSWE